MIKWIKRLFCHKQYVYFVSFEFQGGVGNADIYLRMPIKSMDDIQAIANYISDKTGRKEIAIMNYKLLRVERSADDGLKTAD